MSDTPPDPNKSGNGKAWVTLAATFGTTYGMNYASLHGVNFEVLHIPSELVKSTLEAALLGFFTWATPDHAIDAIVDGILWLRGAAARIKNAFTQKLQTMREP